MFLRGTSLETLSVKTLARTGMTTGSAAFTTTHGMVNRVHNYAAVAGTTTEPTRTTSFTGAFERVLRVADYTYSCATCCKNLASFTRR